MAARRRGTAAIVVLVAAVVGSVGLSRPAAAATFERSVWVQGDSVLAGAADVVRARLAGWDVEIGAFVGLPTSVAVDVLAERRDRLGSVVVLQLGLNDWGYSEASFAGMIDDMMAVLAGKHVIWLTGPRFRPEMDRVNAAIRAAPARHPGLEVLEWGPLSDAHPEATYADGVHLRPAGQQLLADAIGAAVDGWWARRCGTPSDETATHNAVARLYRAYFRRDPDPGGMNHWVPRYRSGELCLTDISSLFAASPEFAATYGPLDVPQFVRLVYVNVLGREPDPDGYTYWAQQLAYGGLGRGELMVGFSESPEFRARTGLP